MTQEASPDPMLDSLLATHLHRPMEWNQPLAFDLGTATGRDELQRQFSTSTVVDVVDRVMIIADELYELRHPDRKDDTALRAAFVQDVIGKGAAYGKWFLFPWSRQLVRYPDQDEHRDLRTSRFKNLVTEGEQRRLFDATVAIYGLSVGSSVAESLVGAGIGGTIVMGDPDHVAPSNLGRIRGSFADVGVGKIDLMARKISEIDPYVKQVHHREGVTPASLDALALHHPDVSVLFDEVDSLPAKALIRQFARRERVAVVMATDVGELSMIDVERYDIEANVRPFHGKLSEDEVAQLADGSVSPAEIRNLMIKLVGVENISQKTMESFLQVGKTLPGIPQLGLTATMGGVHAAIAAREIILGRPLPSGRYVSPGHSWLGGLVLMART